MARFLLATPIFLVATLFLFGSIFAYSSNGSKLSATSIKKTINKNIVIEKLLSTSASYINDFYSENRRYPTTSEYEVWATTQPKNIYDPKNIRLTIDETQYPPEILDRFGVPGENSYVLALWRGEWFEYYVSWKNKTTLTFNSKDYELSFGTFLYMIAVSFLLYFVSALFGSRRLQIKIKFTAAKLAKTYLSPSVYTSIAVFANSSKQYIKVLLVWFSAGILCGLLTAVGEGVGPGSYLIWLAIIGVFMALSFVHCIAIFIYGLLKSMSENRVGPK